MASLPPVGAKTTPLAQSLTLAMFDGATDGALLKAGPLSVLTVVLGVQLIVNRMAASD